MRLKKTMGIVSQNLLNRLINSVKVFACCHINVAAPR
ncbi:hypothetical protein EMIT0158MI4_30360 [Burkholderia ambifaria]